MLGRLVITPAPTELDRLGRPLRGPCLIWIGAKERDGYGLIGNADFGDTKVRPVHRVMFRMFVGPIENELDHLCRIRSCASPAHLEDVTHIENVRRGNGGQASTSKTSKIGKTHCSNGHEFTPENTLIRTGGHGRHCRTCKNARARAKYASEKATRLV